MPERARMFRPLYDGGHMRAMTVGLLLAVVGCGTRPLAHDDGCVIGDPRPISDGFQESALDTRCWRAQLGAVRIAGGVLTVAGGSGYNFAEMETPGGGAGDFTLRARVQLHDLGPRSSIGIGWRSQETNASLAFLLPSSTAQTWHGLVDNASVELSRDVAVGPDYAELEIARVGTLATFSVNGAVVDSREYAADLSASSLRVSASGGGSISVDSIELR